MKTIRKIEKSSSHSFARLRVAAYCRVSTDQYEQLESLETQRSHYDEYIRAHKDWELVNVYYDEGISGTRADTRTGLQRLMADCRLRRIDMVLTKSISRFARNTADCLALVRELISLNIPIHFEKEGIDTSAMESELLLSVMSSLAESESRSISENTKWSFGRQFRNGTFKVRTLPYGYRRVDGGLQIDPEEAQIVKRIFREALSGKGASVIASGFNRDGIMSRQRKGWVHSTIFRILRNEVYTRDALLQKTYTTDFLNKTRVKNNGIVPQYYVEGNHEPYIPKQIFLKVQDELVRRIDMVLTKSISRFARNTADCLALVRELISLNIPIHFEKEGIDTSAMESELLLSVMSFLTESESRSISENTKWSFGRQFRNGRKCGFSSRHVFSQIVFCSECGENFHRTQWNNRGKKSVVWRCLTRLYPKKTELVCHARTVKEDELKAACLSAFNGFWKERDGFQEQMERNIERLLAENNPHDEEKLRKREEELQQELISLANPGRITAMWFQSFRRYGKNRLSWRTIGTAVANETVSRITELREFIRSQSVELTEFDETLVRHWIRKITVHFDRLTIEFKTGDIVETGGERE